MKRSSLLMYLLFLGVLCSWGGAFAAPLTHTDAFHLTPPARYYRAVELDFLKTFRRWFRKQQLRPPALDPGLREAAFRLATQLKKRKLRQLPHTMVKAAMWMGGRADRKIQVFGLAYKTDQALYKALRRSLSRSLAGKRPNLVGVAIVGKAGERVCIAIFARRGALLQALPRWSVAGQVIQIQGRLFKQFQSPSVIIGSPTGQIMRIRVKKHAKGTFSAQWRPLNAGKVTFQLVVKDDEGPWISSECTIEIVSQHAHDAHRKRLWKHYRGLLAGKQKATPSAIKWLSRPTPKRPKGKRRVLSGDTQKAERELLRLVNQFRRRIGLSVLKRVKRLDQFSRSHSKDMVKEHFFAHTSPQNGSFRERIKRLGWKVKLARENIVAARSPKRAFHLLFQSPVHRVNMLLRKIKITGIGVAQDSKGVYFFTQIFVIPK